MSAIRVLLVCHNHPAIRPGGAEAYALELHRALKAADGFESVLLSRREVGSSYVPGSPNLVDETGDPSQHYIDTIGGRFDHFYGRARSSSIIARRFAQFLREGQPDVVHFQHTQFLGYDLVRVARAVLPDAAIVYTLQEFLPICHHNGQMVRTEEEGLELCDHASPLRCHECFPHFSPQSFLLRKRFIQAQLRAVDRFVTPSRFLRDRYVAWGIPAEKILVEDYGRLPVSPSPEPASTGRPRNRLGFFGQMTRFKGVDVLLEAMARLEQRGSAARLRLHGANLELQRPDFRRRVQALLDAAGPNVDVVGRYGHEDLPALMAQVDWVVVPSIWWENSPLVIQEASAYGRPVICSDIGGMAEKVQDGVTGLHFRVGDPVSLAAAIERAIEEPGLWERMRNRLSAPYSMDQHVARLGALYRELDRSPVLAASGG